MHSRVLLWFVMVSISVGVSSGGAAAADWPMWRCDAQRSASTPEILPENLHLQWVRELPTPKACWPANEIRLQFDVSYEPIAAAGMLFVPSMMSDSVTAYDAPTGKEVWRFYTDGPVRFAPVYRQGKVYVASDDGFLYCVDAGDGSLVWKFRGAPSDYKVLGNERLISAWPVRGAPVLDRGTIYFAASIWPFMGTFFYALNADTGKILWENSASGSDYVLQPHGSPAFAGVSPQGYLAMAGDILVVPGGRSVPAGYDRKTGEFLYHHADTKDGEYAFFVGGDYVFNQGRMSRSSDGGHVRHMDASVIVGDKALGVDGEGNVRATSLHPVMEERVDRKGKVEKVEEYPTVWVLKGDGATGKAFIAAGERVYLANNDGLIRAVDYPHAEITQGTAPASVADHVSWTAGIEGKPWTMLVADKRLFVVTEEGRIYCFGENETTPRTLRAAPAPELDTNNRAARWANSILETGGARSGYGLVLGLANGDMVEELLRRSDLHLIGLDPDVKKVDSLRRRFDDLGFYGGRASFIAGDISSIPMAPYFAGLVVARDPAGMPDEDLFFERVFHVLRPYGGTACFASRGGAQGSLVERIESLELPGAAVRAEGSFVLLERKGALPGSAPWTHQYADIANTVCSKDTLVKPPLALLWFGGPSNMEVLPRHGHGPCQQVVGGRLFIEGINVFSARDVYTGRILWKKELPELNTFGMYYNETYNPDPYDRSYNQVHTPGANLYGSNFVATEDRVYLIQEELCLVLDAATGENLAEWRIPGKPGIGVPKWGYVGVYGDLLVAGVAPYEVVKSGDRVEVIPNNRFSAASKHIVVMDRKTGEMLWEREAEYNFRHNTIVAGNGKLFCVDGMSNYRLDLMKRRGTEFASKPRVLALDVRTGDELWSADENVFGTWLGYSEEYDVLLEGGSRAGDRAGDEAGEGMAAYRGADGESLWRIGEAYSGPPILHHERIITQTGGGNTSAPPARVFHLLTGKPVTTTHPLTGEEIPFAWVRFKGCNTAVASEHIMTFRSASACYADLDSGAGTASIGGFKSGCTSNLVAADGVLNAPEYTRTCTCSYQNQTSLALVHAGGEYPWPDVEGWSFDYLPAPRAVTAIERLGVNFGAPGNRYDDDGNLWLEAPSVGGPSPDVPVFVSPADPTLSRLHTSAIERTGREDDDELRWAAASGIEGATRITIRPFLQPGGGGRDVKGFDRHAGTVRFDGGGNSLEGGYPVPRPFTVRLVFAEPQNLRPGERVFDVLIQGERVREGFDVVRAAGGAKRAVSVEVSGVSVKDDLVVDLRPVDPTNGPPPILSGILLTAE